MNQPDDIVFCENDISPTALYKKHSNIENDITVIPVFSIDNDDPDGVIVYGLAKMPDYMKNSLDFHVLSGKERSKAISILLS